MPDMAATASPFGRCGEMRRAKKATTPTHPIMIDSGASGAVVGSRWLKQYGPTKSLHLKPVDRHFIFGGGIDRPSVGVCIIAIQISPDYANLDKPPIIRVPADVVRAAARPL